MSSLRQQIHDRLTALASGELDRGEVADWASQLVRDDDREDLRDPVVWQAVDRLAGADLMSAPGSYLHGPTDFHEWLQEFDDVTRSE